MSQCAACLLSPILSATGATANVALPAGQAAAHGTLAAAAAPCCGCGRGFRERQLGYRRRASYNLTAGLASWKRRVTPFFVGKNIDVQPDLSSWMAGVHDSVLLSEMFIPGSHDSMTFNLQKEYVSCQVWSLERQLRAGVRAFDLRIQHAGDELRMVHGVFDLGLSFADAVSSLEAFVAAHPTECVLVSLSSSGATHKGVHKQSFVEAIVGTFKDSSLWQTPYQSWPRLGQVRGKIVINSYGKEAIRSTSPPPMEVCNKYKEVNSEIFLGFMTEFCTATRVPTTMYGMWLNAVGINDDKILANVTKAFQLDWLKSPGAAAYQNNEGCFDHLSTYGAAIYYMDFPGLELVHRIIERNELLN